MTSPYADLERPPLRAESLRRALVRDGSLWAGIEIVGEASSTNALVGERADAGAAEGLVVVAEHQTAGRGRLDRSWVSPARAGLTFSVLLRPAEVAVQRWSWLPLLAGLAIAEGIDAVAKLPSDTTVALKWPNDLLVHGRKVGGILVERRGDAAVVGVGLNITTHAEELPHNPATDPASSLLIAAAEVTDRDTLLRSMLRGLERRYLDWLSAAGDPATVEQAYSDRCVTLGTSVTVALPDGGRLEGVAARLDHDGRLVVSGPRGEQAVSSGDVVHVRPVA